MNPLPSTSAGDVPRVDIDDERWLAVERRDASKDGDFVYAVSTTGVYCRPSCPSRRPRREHVRAFSTAQLARASGFRACRRCDPDGESVRQRHAAVVHAVCRAIEAAVRPPRLADLAKGVSLSPSRLHRVFTEVVGVTPWAYAAAVRGERCRLGLEASRGVLDAAFGAGHGSVSNAYREAATSLGLTPGVHRSGGRGEVIEVAVTPCSLGFTGIAVSERGICGVALGDTAEDVRAEFTRRYPTARITDLGRVKTRWLSEVVRSIDECDSAVHLPLDIRGTAFQRRVWASVAEICSGQTLSYLEVAQQVGSPRGARAVANACASNPLAYVIPCHRVVGSDESLGGYRWGLARKQELLARETTKPPTD